MDRVRAYGGGSGRGHSQPQKAMRARAGRPLLTVRVDGYSLSPPSLKWGLGNSGGASTDVLILGLCSSEGGGSCGEKGI